MMAEFAEVMKQWRRICDVCTCSNKGELINFPECPIILEHCGYPCDEIPQDWTEEMTEQFEKIVMAWAAEHPEPVYPTWGEWLEDYMCAVEAPIDTPKSISAWMYQTPISEEMAQKLGIEPKEG